MSLQSAIEFTTAAVKDPALAAELKSLTNGKSPEQAAEAFVALGRREGFDFTAAEANELRSQVDSELSEEDLDKVAGGTGSGNMNAVMNQQVLSQIFGQAFGFVAPAGASGFLGAGAASATITAANGGSTKDVIMAFNDGTMSAINTTMDTVKSVFSGW